MVDQLDDLAVQVEGTLPAGAPRYPLHTLQAISRHLYQTLGFRGNKEVRCRFCAYHGLSEHCGSQLSSPASESYGSAVVENLLS